MLEKRRIVEMCVATANKRLPLRLLYNHIPSAVPFFQHQAQTLLLTLRGLGFCHCLVTIRLRFRFLLRPRHSSNPFSGSLLKGINEILTLYGNRSCLGFGLGFHLCTWKLHTCPEYF